MSELKRHLGFKEIFAIASGAMISSGLFVLPSIIYKDLGPYTFLAYVIASVFMIPTLLVKMELVTAMPKSGGDYFYIQRGLGGIIGILGGLANWFSLSLKSAFALIGVGGFIELFTKDFSYSDVKLIAIVFLVIIMLINVFSVELTARFEIVLVFILLSILAFYIITGATHINLEHLRCTKEVGIVKLLRAGGMVFISFGGLTKVSSIAEEAKRPGFTVPRGMIASFITVTILYVLAVLITTGLLSPAEFSKTLEPLSHGGEKIAGKVGLFLVSLAAFTSFVTTANAGILAASRTPLAMARDGLLPPVFGKIHPRFNTPLISLLITGIFMAFSILFFDLRSLVKTASTVMLVLFITVHISYIVIRASKFEYYNPIFKAPLFPYISIASIILYGFLIFELGTDMELLAGIFSIIAIILYLTYSRKNIRRRSALIHLIEKTINREIKTPDIEEELKEIINERDRVTLDRFDMLIQENPVLDFKTRINRDQFFKKVSQVVEEKTGISRDLIYRALIKREEEASTVIMPFIAIPHIILEGEHTFIVLPFRAKEGILFEKDKIVKAGFVLAGTRDERTFHLTALMAIAEILGKRKFLEKWLKAKSEKNLKEFIIKARERRDL